MTSVLDFYQVCSLNLCEYLVPVIDNLDSTLSVNQMRLLKTFSGCLPSCPSTKLNSFWRNTTYVDALESVSTDHLCCCTRTGGPQQKTCPTHSGSRSHFAHPWRHAFTTHLHPATINSYLQNLWRTKPHLHRGHSMNLICPRLLSQRFLKP
jgi:hypothetical protein